nr:hypothetical protein PJ912_01430 [Pectobacterium colocasium]
MANSSSCCFATVFIVSFKSPREVKWFKADNKMPKAFGNVAWMNRHEWDSEDKKKADKTVGMV